MVFVAHLLACFFYMPIPEQLANNVPVESTWIGAYDPDLLDFEKSDNSMRYVAAFYWAVITISTVYSIGLSFLCVIYGSILQ